MKKKMKLRTTIIYELRNICGNPYVHLFGILMPIMLVILFSFITKDQVNAEIHSSVNTTLFGSMAMVIPLAIILLGCAATSAQEIEKKVPLRFQLFGFSEKQMILSRFVAEIILVTVALIIFSLVCCLTITIEIPSLKGLLIWLTCFYVLSTLMFMLAYGLANLIRKFGATYCFSMILYFGAMIVSGMMGVSVEQMPAPMKKVSALLPTSYITADIMDFWKGGSYNFMPMIQAFLFIAAISGIVLYFSVYKARRVLK